MSPHSPSHREWIQALPASEMVYPDTITHRIKYYFWRVYSPYHPTVRDSVTMLTFMRNRGRQPFLLGTIASHSTIEKFVAHLVGKGFAYHRVAWVDEGEVVSLRLVKNFIYQYHIRVFEDGEVRGHYEYTPECYPLLHILEIGHEDRREKFFGFFGDHVTPHTDADQSDYRLEFLPLRQYLWRRTTRVQEVLCAPIRPSTDRK